MKTSYKVPIIVVIGLSVSIIHVYALPILYTVEDLEKLSKYTIKGKIIDIKPIILHGKPIASDNQRRVVAEVSIKVENDLQDQHANDTIKFRVTNYVTLNPFSKSINNPLTFQIGENVTMFLTGKEPESDFANNYAGFIANKHVFSEGIAYDVTSTKQVSPLQQHKSGTLSRSVNCNDGLELLIKATNGQPICVKPETKAQLVERGWATQ